MRCLEFVGEIRGQENMFSVENLLPEAASMYMAQNSRVLNPENHTNVTK